MTLLGREAECELIDRLIARAVIGRSGVVVLRGEAGIGKSALLGYACERAEGALLTRAVGVESEMELAYNGLHQLCVPMLDQLQRLPPPQLRALATVFGLMEGSAPNKFLVGLATLTLFAEVAEHQPLVCIVDDAQWFDQVSLQILGFVARRLFAERAAIVCAARSGIGDEILAGLPVLSVRGLGDSDALALLLANLRGPLDASVSRRIVAESRGNPLALLELPRTWRVADLAGGFALPDHLPVAAAIEASYVARLRELPVDAQLLVLAAAAEPVGDPLLLHRAADRLGIDVAAAEAADDAGLLRIRGRAEFAHPLVRSSVYRSATAHDRHRVHRALADATDADTDPDRRAWHRACATPGPDDDVAAQLERSAGRAQARGGIAAAAAFLQRAVELTSDRAQRAERAVTAAQLSFQAGRFDAAQRLLDMTEAASPDALQRARVATLRGQVALVSNYGRAAAPLLLHAAKELERFDMDLARKVYLTAWGAAVTAGHLGGADILREICRAVRGLAPLTADAHPLHLLLDGLALLTTDGRAAATPVLQHAAQAIHRLSVEDVVGWGRFAPAASKATWDWDGYSALDERVAKVLRDAGELAELPLHLHSLALDKVLSGDFPDASALIAEAEAVAAATGTPIPRFASLWLWSRQGREVDSVTLAEATIEAATAAGQGIAVMSALWSLAVLYNGLGRYDEALSAARRVFEDAIDPWHSIYILPEVVEAAVRVGDFDLSREALERMAETTLPEGPDLGQGLEARCRAIVSNADAEGWYWEAIERIGRTGARTELARTHLLYGEWLRRKGRRVDARQQLRAAYDMFVAIGMDAFVERTGRELTATGVRVRRRSPETRNELTPQEEQVARLARDGRSNAEIGTQLFISVKTVEWHLGKVFTKLGVSSRRQLRTALPNQDVLIERA
jgi:DNA-binding CsgD family transcriptional regulator